MPHGARLNSIKPSHFNSHERSLEAIIENHTRPSRGGSQPPAPGHGIVLIIVLSIATKLHGAHSYDQFYSMLIIVTEVHHCCAFPHSSFFALEFLRLFSLFFGDSWFMMVSMISALLPTFLGAINGVKSASPCCGSCWLRSQSATAPSPPESPQPPQCHEWARILWRPSR